MKCGTCEGLGYKEYEAGLIRLPCPDCKGIGEIKDSESLSDIAAEANAFANALMPRLEGEPLKVEGTEDTFTGLLFQLAGKRTDEYSDAELWKLVKETSLEKIEFPYVLTMPCGHKEVFHREENITGLPIKDIPCPCGNPNHYIVRLIDKREENDSNSGTGQLNSIIGSTDTGKPKQSRKSKARKGTKRRTG